jgi:P4 family phage/plasmid primase-like protien
VPYQPSGRKAKSNTPSTWTGFEEVLSAYESGDFTGIGFMFGEDGPYVGVDLDGCVTDGDLTGGAWDIVKRLDSYTEGSPSGTGLHIICRGFLPDLGNRTPDIPGMKGIEFYDAGRYFTVTGRVLGGEARPVEQRAQELYDLCTELFEEDAAEQQSAPSTPNDLEDQELVEKAKTADDGGKFARLWSGDTSMHDDDHSRADQALVNKLAFWTGGDRDRIDQLFRQSGLCREKWIGRPDYRKRTIDKALDGRTKFYDPSSPSENHRTNGQAGADGSGPWDKIRATYQDDKGQARLFAADQLESDLDVATHRRSGHLYVWDPEGKVYADDGEQSIRSRLMEKLRSDFSQHEVREIIGMVKAKTYRSEFGAEGFIPVANGDLKVTANSAELKNATPERGFRTRSPAEWDPEADAPIFRTYLEQVVQTEEERRTLQEYAGYSLMYWGLPYHKALFLVGPQASGKSTFLKVLQEMLGKTTQLSPQQLVDDDYGAIELEDSWANLASDIPSELLSNVGRFKEITAGDRIFAERKYEQGYTIEPTAKHFYSANQLPEIKIDDNAFFRRVMIVAFPETIDREQRDPELPEKLELELDGVLQWAANGLQRLMQNEGFTRDLKPEETRRVWDEHASSIGQFKIRRLEVTNRSEDVEAKQDVYQAYGEFCIENGLPTESKQLLTRTLTRDPRIGQADRTPEEWSKQTSCYTGVRLPREDASADAPGDARGSAGLPAGVRDRQDPPF